jgi:hypothetical protein
MTADAPTLLVRKAFNGLHGRYFAVSSEVVPKVEGCTMEPPLVTFVGMVVSISTSPVAAPGFLMWGPTGGMTIYGANTA